ncbi:MAG: magnesium chelatase subunit H, partial [Thermoplasmata archaeon]
MGSFHARKIFARQPDMGFDVDTLDISRGLKMMEFVKKMGNLFPLGGIRHARNWALAMDYWQYGGKENQKNLLLFLAREYGKEKRIKITPPINLAKMGIYHPRYDKFFADLDEFMEIHDLRDDKPKVGIFFYGGMHFDDCLPVVKCLSNTLEPDIKIIPVFSEVRSNLEAFKTFFFKDGRPLVDVILNLQYFRIHGGPFGGDPKPTQEVLKALDCPVFGSVHMYQTEIDKWKRSKVGFSPIEVVIALALRELDGCIEPLVLSGLTNLGFNGDIQSEVKASYPMNDRIERFKNRLKRWLSLQKKKNNEKRIALIIYDYPPGEHNLGNASYLDVFSSLEKILSVLKERGYSLEIPRGELKDLFLKKGLANSPEWSSVGGIKISGRMYLEWLKELPQEVRSEMMEKWGDPPGEVMTFEEEILIPGVILGNIFLGIQPSRGVHEDPEKSYHDRDLPPHHQYLAFYRWIERKFKADALIHLGTHGTLEFTKGKEVGLSSCCFPDILIGDLPHIYIYWVTNSSEATIAKRRSYATIVNHQTPSFTTSGLYQELSDLEDLIHEYQEAKVQDPLRAETVSKEIFKRAKESNLLHESVEEIQSALCEIKRSIIPRGLHVLGEDYSKEELSELITLILRYDREVESLHRIIAEIKELDYEELLRHPHKGKGDKSYGEILAEIEAMVKELVRGVWEGLSDEELLLEVPRRLRKRVGAIFSYVRDLRSKIEGGREMENLLKALEGGYIQPNIGGDPIRTPEVFPTGCNTYQFDPRLIPSAAAFERGANIAETTLTHYLEKEGRYPETVSVVLWGFETVKTRGETIAQILQYLGLRLVRKSGPWFSDLEVIPLERLKRPRIDVVVTICGIFRDTFPNLIKLLSEAFRLTASLDEPLDMNLIKKHSEEIASKFSDEEGERLANLRIFGPKSGEYATSMRTLIETSRWEKEEDLSRSYLESMQYGYGEDIHAESASEVFKTLLSRVDLISQVRDTHEFEITELDHYYEFFGGLSRSIESVRGKKPEMLIADTTKELIQVEEVKRSIERSIRTRFLNPTWIEGMLKHKFHGGQKISERVEYLLGLAATTGRVDDWVWSGISRRYIFDEKMRDRLKENNPFATSEIIKRL